MNFHIDHHPFVNELVRTMCLTFLHSLWQSLIAAVLAGAFLMLTKKNRPALRYNVIVGILSILMLVNGITFFLLIPGADQAVSDITVNAATVFVNADLQNVTVTNYNSLISNIIAFCNEHATTIVAIWLMIFLWKSFQATVGLLHLNHIRKNGVSSPSNHWKDVFADLARKLAIREKPLFLESENVTVPMVIGHFKPMVLVPLGMLANMPAAQVEAILLHELAHIRRRDYLVNLIQIFCENIYFFNPAILWISYLIRQEREHCCDDLAIGITENKTSFVHALVSFQEYSLSGNAVQIAFSRKRNHLLDRVKRIINHNNKSLDAMEKLFVTLSLVAAVGLSAAISPKTKSGASSQKDHQRIYSEQAPAARIPAVTITDTLPKKKPAYEAVHIHSANVYSATEGVSTYDITVDGTHYQFIKKNGKVVSLDVDGKEIPEVDFNQYKDVLAQIELKVKTEHEKAEKEREKAEKMRAEAEVEREHAAEMRLIAEKSRAEAEAQRQKAKTSQVEAEQFRASADQIRKQAELLRGQAEKMREEAEKMRKQAQKSQEEAEIMRKDAEKMRESYEKKQSLLINDLLKAGVIKDSKDLSFILSANELIVNGHKQSSDLHTKLREQYLDDNAEMVYNHKGRTGYVITGTVHKTY